MNYIDPEGQYPRHLGDIWLKHPNYKEGEPLPDGWFFVEQSDYPETKKYQKVNELFPVEVDGVYKQQFEIVEMTDEEKARVDAPVTAKAKLIDLGLTEIEIEALVRELS